ncbi:hypothetical protein Acr_16g0003630 [Actinidia rufa]|uniref:Transmembrane protein n=1 Tax=Actinidia rufa TaxID=165716 RepID=A0A7J0FYG6_9ERIC|nr:hypothetical protein Acr_16g0003630 [Actinidia rufa]
MQNSTLQFFVSRGSLAVSRSLQNPMKIPRSTREGPLRAIRFAVASLLNSTSEIVQPTVEDQNDTEAGASGGISSTSMFVNSEPMQEEEEQNADPPQKVSNAQPAGTNQDGPVTSSSNVQPQVSTQITQPSSAAPAGVSSTLKRSRFHWFYALLAAVGIIALCGLAVRFLALSAGTAVLFKVLSKILHKPAL